MKIIANNQDEIRLLERYIRDRARPGETLRILEAGCGREWLFRMDDVDYELTGVDLDGAALQARLQERRDLHRSIVGDLRTVELEPGGYDIIYSAFVLEHVPGAQRVLENFVRWLKPGGAFIVRVPDITSAHAFIARLTPHWFHVLYYRWAWRLREAGKPGFPPYVTIYDRVVSPPGLRAFCASHGLEISDQFGAVSFRNLGHGLAGLLTPVVARLVKWFTFGRIHDNFVCFTLVAEKPATLVTGKARPDASPGAGERQLAQSERFEPSLATHSL
jgi:SAM-dependent methyltransferase